MRKEKILSLILACATLFTSVPAYANTQYTDSQHEVIDIDTPISNDSNSNCEVYAEIGSEFKVTIPKHITLDGATKTGTYNVNVEGDIAGTEIIKVIPEEYFRMYTTSKNEILAFVEQDKMEWNYQTLGTLANGLIETEGMTAGAWNGTFYFNVKLESQMKLPMFAVNKNNEQIEIESNNVTGVQKEQLLDALVQSGQVSEDETIDTMINISTTENVEKVEIDTTGVAEPGDTVVVVHEKENEWDYVSTETVDTNNKVTVNVGNKKPVSFVQTQSDGTVHIHNYTEDILSPATCSVDGTLSMTCNCNRTYLFTIPASHNLEVVEKKDENGNLINKYYECTNCTYSILNLTKLFAGNELSHDCNNYTIDKYDETYHWKECSVPDCGRIIGSKTKHVLKTTDYNYGYASCYPSNSRTTYCTSCGYSKTFSDPHPGHSSWKNSSSTYVHYKNCTSCYGWTYSERCKKSDGSLITCTNLGTCATCNFTYTTSNTQHYVSSYNGKCSICSSQVIEKIEPVQISYSSDRKYAYATYTIKGSGFSNPSSYSLWENGNILGTSRETLESTSTTHTFRYTITQNSTVKTVYAIAPRLYINVNGRLCYIGIESGYTRLKYEENAPTINAPVQNTGETSNGWATQNQLTFSGTEDFCNIVYLTLKDDADNIYIDNASAVVTNKNWSYTCTPDIEANVEGRIFTLTVQDTLGNISEKTFTVSKTDRKSPQPNLNINISTNWSQTKEVLFTAVDEGSGNVKIAFNNINEYVNMDKNGSTYTKGYQFSGDVYGSIQAAIYYTDAAGNVATQFITVYNLDNTAPTISNVTVNGKQITVTANDLNTELNMEGSGISGYALTWTSAPPQDSDWQNTNVLEIPKSGTYYIWVKDAVGNISECYQVKIIL